MKKINFSSVSETLFLPLYARAIESESNNPIINDLISIDLVKTLDENFKDSDSKMLQAMLKRKLPKYLPVSMGLRTRAFDRYTRRFIETNPNSIVINLGCGLDTRFQRIDNGVIDWYNIDLPPVIKLRKELMEPVNRETNISSSVLDNKWFIKITPNNRPILILAEGLFMYLDENSVKKLLLDIQKYFGNYELVAEVSNYSWVKKFKSPFFKWRFKKRLHMGEDSIFTYGIKNSKEFETFGKGISYIDEWNYFDEKEKKMGIYNILGKIKAIRNVQWTVHYSISS